MGVSEERVPVTCPECRGNPPEERGPTGWHCETCWSYGFILLKPSEVDE